MVGACSLAMAGAGGVAALELPQLEGFLGSLPEIQELLGGAPPLALLTLLAAYTLPDGEWADVHGLYDAGLEGLPEGAAGQLVSVLLAGQYDEMREVLELFGAAESEGATAASDASALWLFGVSAASDPLPSGRFRLTPLGRAGVRELLVTIGVPAPVMG